MTSFTFDSAVDVLDKYLQTKTVHNTREVCQAMQSLCGAEWTTVEDQQEFANICSNFDKWVKETARNSIGRKQFEEWWEVQGTDETGNWSDESLAELQEDPLPDFGVKEVANMLEEVFSKVDNSKTAHDLKKENTELRKKVEELTEAVRRYEKEREEMRRMLTWGLNN